MPLNGHAPRTPQLIWLGDAIKPADFPRFHIYPLLVAGSFHAIIGPYKEGKSFAALEASIAIAYKQLFFGRYPVDVGCPVLYIAGEGALETRMRFEAVRRQRGLEGQRVAIWQEPFDFKNPSDCKALSSLIIQHEFGAFVVDTASRCGAGDESSIDMPLFIDGITKVMRSTASTCILVHHTPDGDKTKARGHSSLPAAFDATWLMRKDAGLFKLKNKFSRWSAADDKVLSTFQVEPFPLGENVDGREIAPGIIKFETMTERRQKALALLKDGKSQREIADELGIALSTVQCEVAFLKAAGYWAPPKKAAFTGKVAD